MRWFGSINRALLTAALLLSWTVTTSHCALAAATTAISTAVTANEESASDECPMHSSKSAKEHAPERKKGCTDLPCCKNLPAAKPLAGISACKPPMVLVALHCLGRSEQLDLSRPVRLTAVFGTGPPRPGNFLDVVLRRSIPAHAPPVC